MIKKGEELSVKVIELSAEGKGVSKLEDGFVIFSSGTLPGDEALIKIIKKKTNYAEAKLVKVITPSQYRTEPVCSYFGVCGGCRIQNYDYGMQTVYKTETVRNALERIGGFRDLNIPGILKCDEIFFYRNKMEFSFSDDEWMTEKDSGQIKEKFALGLHVPKFHSKIINTEKCYLQSERSNDIVNFTRGFFKSRGVSVYSTKTGSGFLRFLIIRQSRNTNDLMINIITFDFNEELLKEYTRQLILEFPFITSIVNSISKKKAQVAIGEAEVVLYGNGFIYENLKSISGKEYRFKISPQSFFQTNTGQAEKLFNTVIEMSGFEKKDNVLDLYCGAGSISIFISDTVNKVYGVEIVNDAVKDALINAELNGVKNAEFVCSDIKEFIERNENMIRYNKLILDPPRSGLHPKICEALSETGFEKIIYVSCNPHTQARDLQIICGKGRYSIEKIQPVDMFPHTYHVENIVSLVNLEFGI